MRRKSLFNKNFKPNKSQASRSNQPEALKNDKIDINGKKPSLKIFKKDRAINFDFKMNKLPQSVKKHEINYQQ